MKGFFRSLWRRNPKTQSTHFRSYRMGDLRRRKPIQTTTTSAPSKPLNRREQRYQFRWQWTLKIGIGLSLFILSIYGIFFSALFQIRTIEVQGENDTLEEQAALRSYLEVYLGNSLILFPPSQHEAFLLRRYPYLKDIQIHRQPFHTLRASLSTYPHVANIQIEFENGDKQFFICNEKGLISGMGTANPNLPTIIMDITGTDLSLPEKQSEWTLNKALLSPETLQVLLKAKSDMEAKFNIQVLEVYYLKRAREVHLFTERNFFVWIDLTQDLTLQFNKLKKAMTEINLYEDPLSYIDLRISGQNGEKVIYKLNET